MRTSEPCRHLHVSVITTDAIYCVQRSAKVDAPGCVNAAGKLGRSDKLQQ